MVGGAVAVATGNPIAGALAAFVSHFVLDAIPHWDYEVDAVDKGDIFSEHELNQNKMKTAMLKVGFDGLLGMSVPLILAYVLGESLFLVFLGAGFAILPDFLQFVYLKTKTTLLHGFMEFHHGIHSHIRLDGKPLVGLFTQSLFWVAAVVVMWHF